ncbi:MAG: two-component system response regulator [Blastopirellula sp.]|nr:MAG: two-component system response regulator [Blastopirellula sp.]
MSSDTSAGNSQFDPSKTDLLIVDDDHEFRATLVRRFSRRGFQVYEADSAEQALQHAENRQFNVAVFDLVMPGMSGLDLLKIFQENQPECEVLILTGQGSVQTAVEGMKHGAFDFLSKPFSLSALESLLEKASGVQRLKQENTQMKTLLRRNKESKSMIGESAVMQEVYRLIERAAPSETAILIQGESGTGKELVASALHKQSLRCDKPMVIINCAALPESLLESELFGHEKGSFTGAVASKAGLFEIADGGTLFIDEIGEMPGSLQAKLLRVLEDGSMRRIGSLKERRVDVRLLAATNRDMGKMVEEGDFREDLFYRINVMSLQLPPLRERTGDIPRLVDHFLGKDWDLAEEADAAIERYYWPGNVRQLSNALERGKIMADDGIIQAAHLPREVLESKVRKADSIDADTSDLATVERSKVIQALRRERNNKTKAAQALGIGRRKLYRLIDKYEIQEAELSG